MTPILTIQSALPYGHSTLCNLLLFNHKYCELRSYLSEVPEPMFSCNFICRFLSTWYMHSKLIQVHWRLSTMSEWQKRQQQTQAQNTTPLPLEPHLEWSSTVFKQRAVATPPRIRSVIIHQINILESISLNEHTIHWLQNKSACPPHAKYH